MSEVLDKQEIIKKYQIHEKDSGSCEVQIAVLSSQIKHLTEHLKIHPKDFHSRRGLIQMTNKRRRLLAYLFKNETERFEKIIESLGLRRTTRQTKTT